MFISTIRKMAVSLTAFLLVYSLAIFSGSLYADEQVCKTEDEARHALEQQLLRGESDISIRCSKDVGSVCYSVASLARDMTITEEYLDDRGDFIREAVTKRIEAYGPSYDHGTYVWRYKAEPRMTKTELDTVYAYIETMTSRCFKRTDKDKVRYYSQQIANTFEYDKSFDGTLAESISEKKGCCLQYSLLLYLACKESGIEARTMRGDFDNGETREYHEWCIVKLGDRWVYVDPTLFAMGKQLFPEESLPGDYGTYIPDSAYTLPEFVEAYPAQAANVNRLKLILGSVNLHA